MNDTFYREELHFSKFFSLSSIATVLLSEFYCSLHYCAQGQGSEDQWAPGQWPPHRAEHPASCHPIWGRATALTPNLRFQLPHNLTSQAITGTVLSGVWQSEAPEDSSHKSVPVTQ